MTQKAKGHIGFFVAGFVLMSVLANIYMTYHRSAESTCEPCPQSTSTQ